MEKKGRKEDWLSENHHGDSEAVMALQSCPLLEQRGQVFILSFRQVIG